MTSEEIPVRGLVWPHNEIKTKVQFLYSHSGHLSPSAPGERGHQCLSAAHAVRQYLGVGAADRVLRPTTRKESRQAYPADSLTVSICYQKRVVAEAIFSNAPELKDYEGPRCLPRLLLL